MKSPEKRVAYPRLNMEEKIRKSKKIAHRFVASKYISFVLGGDISATNSTLAIAGVKKGGRFEIIITFHIMTAYISSLPDLLRGILIQMKNDYKISVSSICLGIAAPVEDENKNISMTNSSLRISKRELVKSTKIKDIRILNDFEIIGYSLNVIAGDKSRILAINRPGTGRAKHAHSQGIAVKAIIGAGTGLGKSILVFDKVNNAYVPIRSEGGHADFPLQDEFDIALAAFLRGSGKVRGSIQYEDIISGKGISNIYSYLQSTGRYRQTSCQEDVMLSRNSPEIISAYSGKDRLCRDTMQKFADYYAMAARNFALEALCFGGLYIAGGIAGKNKGLFTSRRFSQGFQRSSMGSRILKDIPIYLITDYECSLYGACYFAARPRD